MTINNRQTRTLNFENIRVSFTFHFRKVCRGCNYTT